MRKSLSLFFGGLIRKDPERARKLAKARWVHIAALLIAACSGIACEMSASIDADHEPVLQIDAVFFEGESLPEIAIRTSFRTSMKGEGFLVDRESLFITGAQVELRRNGDPVPLVEKSPGHYKAASGETARAGDRFEIEVIHGDMRAQAVATVPDINMEELVVEPAGEVDVVWGRGNFSVQFQLPDLPAFTAVRVYSEEERERESTTSLTLDIGAGNIHYKAYYGRDYEREDRLSIAHASTFQFPFQEEDLGKEKTEMFPFYYDVVIPEPVYEIWHRYRYNFGDFTPITTTNVEGGVGLFIGAIRTSGKQEAEVVVRYVP